MAEEEDPFAMTTRNLAPNILAKAYATECLKLLHVVTKQVCHRYLLRNHFLTNDQFFNQVMSGIF